MNDGERGLLASGGGRGFQADRHEAFALVEDAVRDPANRARGATAAWATAVPTSQRDLLIDHGVERSEQVVEAGCARLENPQRLHDGFDGRDELGRWLFAQAVATLAGGGESNAREPPEPRAVANHGASLGPGPVDHDQRLGALVRRERAEVARVIIGVEQRRMQRQRRGRTSRSRRDHLDMQPLESQFCDARRSDRMKSLAWVLRDPHQRAVRDGANSTANAGEMRLVTAVAHRPRLEVRGVRWCRVQRRDHTAIIAIHRATLAGPREMLVLHDICVARIRHGESHDHHR